MPVYNGERFIANALTALLGQSFEDFELIISDNASTDRTEEICRDYVGRDRRVRYYRNARNLGLAKNHRRVFELSSGVYFKWAAHDDLCAPDFLARCVEVLDGDDRVALAFPKSKIIDEFGEVQAECNDGLHLQSPRASERLRRLFRNLRLSNALYGMIPRRVLSQTRLVGDYPSADIPLLAELCLRGYFYEIPQFLFFRRLHPAAAHCDPDPMRAYNPEKAGRLVLREWRLLYEHWLSVNRVSLPLLESMRVRLLLLRGGVWNRDELFKELVSVLRMRNTSISPVARSSRRLARPPSSSNL